jgi:hypothetical protein
VCCRPVILCLINCIAETVQVTKDRKYFVKGYMLVSPGIKVKQPLLWTLFGTFGMNYCYNESYLG